MKRIIPFAICALALAAPILYLARTEDVSKPVTRPKMDVRECVDYRGEVYSDCGARRV